MATKIRRKVPPRRILVLSPHPDDADHRCGGTIAKFKRAGYIIYHHVFSPCKESVKDSEDKSIRVKECKKAGTILGVDKLAISHFPVRNFEKYRQNILELLFKIDKVYKPNFIFAPSINDNHQDHKTIANEAKRAFRYKTIYGYRGLSNDLHTLPTMFCGINERDLKLKLKALNCYKSQSDKLYMNRDYIVGLAITTGAQAGKKFAESFEILRYVI